jgi:hypothetical protein
LHLSAPEVRRNLLFHRREVWLPTLWGWAAMLLIVGGIATSLLLNANQLLSVNKPALGLDGKGARTLVVEGWLDPPELQQAVMAFRRGHYERVLTTGGPIEEWHDAGGWKNFALRGAGILRARGLADVPIIALPAPETKQDRTYASALMVRAWERQSGVKLGAIDLFSSGVHTRRSKLVFGMALGSDVEVGALAAQPSEYDPVRWWTSSAGAKATMGEIVSLAWTGCCFWPSWPSVWPSAPPSTAP